MSRKKIRYTCPSCNMSLESPLSDAHEVKKCPSCHSDCRVPEPAKNSGGDPLAKLQLVVFLLALTGGLAAIPFIIKNEPTTPPGNKGDFNKRMIDMERRFMDPGRKGAETLHEHLPESAADNVKLPDSIAAPTRQNLDDSYGGRQIIENVKTQTDLNQGEDSETNEDEKREANGPSIILPESE